jgi:glycosyltransferase involved in cell wall biosynthesis
MKKRDKVTFIFQRARLERINSSIPFAKDMFYTYFNFKEEFETEIIEFGNFPKGRRYKIIFRLEEKIRTLLKIPLYSIYLTNKKNYQKIASSTHVICSTNRAATSSFPMMLMCKLLNKKVNFSFFVLGLYASKPRYLILKKIQSIFYFLLFSLTKNVIFIGEGEYKHAIKENPKFSRKFSYIPFGIDVDFWKTKITPDFENKKKILFIGNDSNRDFNLVVKIASSLPNFDFIFVTSEISKEKIPSNVTLYSGNWGNQLLTDTELKEIYEKSRITIIPLKQTLQPSGQSVAMQSMLIGTPVIISEIDGLWDSTKLVDDDNIIFAESLELEEWKDKITRLYDDQERLSRLSKNSIKLIEDFFSLNLFYKKIKILLNI